MLNINTSFVRPQAALKVSQPDGRASDHWAVPLSLRKALLRVLAPQMCLELVYFTS